MGDLKCMHRNVFPSCGVTYLLFFFQSMLSIGILKGKEPAGTLPPHKVVEKVTNVNLFTIQVQFLP